MLHLKTKDELGSTVIYQNGIYIAILSYHHIKPLLRGRHLETRVISDFLNGAITGIGYNICSYVYYMNQRGNVQTLKSKI